MTNKRKAELITILNNMAIVHIQMNSTETKTYLLEKTAANFAAFITMPQHEDCDRAMFYDMNKNFICETIGCFMNRCPNQTFKANMQEILLKADLLRLYPLQDARFCTTEEMEELVKIMS